MYLLEIIDFKASKYEFVPTYGKLVKRGKKELKPVSDKSLTPQVL